MPTLADVAKRAGVALSTVSAVLNNRPDCFVSEETRQRILQAAEELGYRPNYLARSLAKGKTDTIGLVIYEVANPYFAYLADEVEKEVRQAGYQLLLCTNRDGMDIDDRSNLELLSNQRVDGILLWASRYPAEGYTVPLPKKIKSRIPMVVLGYHTKDGTDYVSIDRAAGTYQATKHLIALGHRRIGYLAPPWGMNPEHPKLDGILRALKEEGLPDPVLMLTQGHTRLDGRSAVQAIKEQNPFPTALICYNDLVAIGAYRGLRDLGLSVPEDIALVGFDGIEDGEYLDPPLTTVTVPVTALSQIAVHFLLNRISGEVEEQQKEVVIPELLVRGSCGAKPKQTIKQISQTLQQGGEKR
ncbi:MAG: LacI family transcriptional regulator [Armatimonadetes bacterium]|nr:LacI family transcriptional regulator [Armatimonadota bacterium]